VSLRKEALFDMTLEHYGVVDVHFAPSDKCVLPEHLRDQKMLTLRLGRALPVPVKDLFFDGDGFSATLSFNRVPRSVFVPWESVVGIVGCTDAGRPEVSVAWERACHEPEKSQPAPAPTKRGSHLRLVKPN